MKLKKKVKKKFLTQRNADPAIAVELPVVGCHGQESLLKIAIIENGNVRGQKKHSTEIPMC